MTADTAGDWYCISECRPDLRSVSGRTLPIRATPPSFYRRGGLVNVSCLQRSVAYEILEVLLAVVGRS